MKLKTEKRNETTPPFSLKKKNWKKSAEDLGSHFPFTTGVGVLNFTHVHLTNLTYDARCHFIFMVKEWKGKQCPEEKKKKNRKKKLQACK